MRKILLLIAAFVYIHAGYAQISSFPHFTDFESEGLCGTSCVGTCNLTGHWQNADQYGFAQAGTDWLAEDGPTPSTSTGPDVDHTLGTATGKYVYVETSGCTNVEGHLVSGLYDFTAISAPKISFWYHLYGATMGAMHLDVDTTGTGTWVLDVIPAWTDNLNIWQLKDVAIPDAANRPNVRIRFRMATGTSFTSDAAVDDITVYQPQPNDLTMEALSVGGGCGNSACTPVEITLINNGTATIPAGTQIPVSFEVNAVTVTDTIVTAVDIANLDSIFYTFQNGCVDLSVPTNVNVTAWSSWSSELSPADDTLTISTMGIPIIATYPYEEDFESGQNGWRINNLTLGSWAFGTPAKTIINSASSGVNCFVNGGLTGTYVDNDASYIEGPCFDFTNICDPVLSVDVWWNAEFSWDGMNVTISTDGGTTWQLVGALGDPLNWYTDNSVAGNPGGYQSAWSGRNSTLNGSGGWLTARHRLIGAENAPNVKIRFNFGSDNSVIDDGVAFDNVKIFNGTDLGPDSTICSPAVALLNGYHGAGTTFLWSTGDTTETINADTTGWYFVDITSSVSCTVRDSVYIASFDANSVVALGADVTACAPVSQTLNAGYWPGAVYNWSTGESGQTITINTTGDYFVDVITPCNTLRDTISVIVNALPVVDLGVDTIYCGNGMLDAQNAGAMYLWNDNSTAQTLTVSSSGIFYVELTDSNGCANTDTISVIVNSLPVVDLGVDTAACGQITLDAGNNGNIFSWNTGDTLQTIDVTASGDYFVTVTDGNSCSATDTTSIVIYANPNVSASVSDSMPCVYDGDVTLNGTPAGGTWSGPGVTGQLFDPSVGVGSQTLMYDYTDGNGCSGSVAVEIVVDNCAGIDEVTAETAVIAFPNPNSGSFQLSIKGFYGETTVSVYDMTGQQVYNTQLAGLNGNATAQVNFKPLSTGMYLVKVMNATQMATVRVNIQH